MNGLLAILGGSGLGDFPGLDGARRAVVTTPWGAPSSPLVTGRVGAQEVVFLQRHGEGHVIPPHLINYRANLWALHARGARSVVAIATVGGIAPAFAPGALAVPDQIIDYTHSREATYALAHDGPVRHVDFTHPYAAVLRARLLAAGRRAGVTLHDGGTYGATQGPRLETAAEIVRMERDGAQLVGMTGMPEAALSRELGLDYAALAVVVNWAAGKGDSAAGIRLDAIAAVSERAMMSATHVIAEMAARDGD
jgi:5'-deoxy-5'-methylthioadenosine phosphorylase